MPYGFNDDKSKYDLTDLIDAELDATSENAIQNKAVKAAIDDARKLYGVDTTNIIASGTTPYTATEDCYIVLNYSMNERQTAGYIDGVSMFARVYGSGLFVKTGQTLTGTPSNINYVAYGLKS